MLYCALKDVKILDEIDNIGICENIEDVYIPFSETKVYNVEKVYGSDKFRIIKEIPDKDIKKALEKKYKKLDIAIMFNDLASVKKIYALKTPVKRSSDYSFAYAVSSKNLNIVKFIFEQGEIDISSYYTKECLIIACEVGSLDIVKYLIKIGLNPCDLQYYPIIWSRKNNYDDITSYLEKDIKKRLGSLPEIKDPYEIILENKEKANVVDNTKIDIDDKQLPDEKKSSGRGVVKSKLEKPSKPKKEIKSLEELKKKSSKLLKDKPKKEVKIEKSKKKEKPKPTKKVLSLNELKKRSEKLLKK